MGLSGQSEAERASCPQWLTIYFQFCSVYLESYLVSTHLQFERRRWDWGCSNHTDWGPSKIFIKNRNIFPYKYYYYNSYCHVNCGKDEAQKPCWPKYLKMDNILSLLSGFTYFGQKKIDFTWTMHSYVEAEERLVSIQEFSCTVLSCPVPGIFTVVQSPVSPPPFTFIIIIIIIHYHHHHSTSLSLSHLPVQQSEFLHFEVAVGFPADLMI